jgi:hypothetical protein
MCCPAVQYHLRTTAVFAEDVFWDGVHRTSRLTVIAHGCQGATLGLIVHVV